MHHPARTGTALDPVRQVELASGQNLWACYQCGKCTADCPFSLTPSLVLRLLQLGQAAEARALATTWECASCYTCATGCPKGVSPARVMKALRVLDGALAPRALPGARSDRAIGRLRARALASMPRLFRLASALAPASNWLARAPGARHLAHLVLGIHRERPLPPFARESFPAWFSRRAPSGDGRRGTVLLFHDTFMDYCYPGVGAAATEVLERAGFRVELTDTVCCGRPSISKGFAADARSRARTNVARLYEPASRGVYIVGCEPSCLMSFRDEYPHLVPAEEAERARVVARQVLLIDEFLARLRDRRELELPFRGRDGLPRALFHAHCHQKAFASPAASLEVLALAGYEVELVNAACCGMAGAYGFEKEHYEPSRRAGERALFPAVRARPDAQLVVMGASCRQQLEHFTGRPAVHFAEALRDATI
jgi:Fe-S oxidoreductase